MTRAVAVFGEDQRQDLAQAAARAERANQPRHLLWLSGLALAVSLMVLTFAWKARANAMKELDRQRAVAQRVADASGRLKALDQLGGDTGPTTAEPDNFLNSRIEAAGVTAGLKERVALPKASPRSAPRGLNSEQVKLVYEQRDPSMEALLRWVKGSTEDVPGLEVYSFQIEPEAQAWKVKVTFSRWQRAEGT